MSFVRNLCTRSTSVNASYIKILKSSNSKVVKWRGFAAHSVLHQVKARPSNNDVASYYMSTGSNIFTTVQYYLILNKKLESLFGVPSNLAGFSTFTYDLNPGAVAVVE